MPQAVFGPQADRQRAEPAVHHLARPPAGEVHVAGGREHGEQAEQRLVGRRQLGNLAQAHERAVVVEHEHHPRGAGEAAHQAFDLVRAGQAFRAAARLGRFRERGQEPLRPVVHMVRQHAAPQRPHACGALHLAHRHRVRHRVGHAVLVVGVDDHGLAQLLGGARELAEEQHAVLVGPRGDVLLRHQVHAVAQRRHQHRVGGAVQRGELLGRDGAVQVVNRHRIEGADRAVDAAHQFLDLLAEAGVLLDLAS